MKQTMQHHNPIALKAVSKTYATAAGTFNALQGVDLAVEAGEFVALVGKSGSGKSTLLNMVAGIDRPTAGEIFVADTAVHSLRESKMAAWRGKHVGVVFQFFQLLPTLTALENIILAMDFCRVIPAPKRRRRAVALLGDVGLERHLTKLPDALSGGEQQRVAIARALANDPPILVADEPTGNLDSHTGDAVLALFAELAGRGKTILMVTHETGLFGTVSRTVEIGDGRILND